MSNRITIIGKPEHIAACLADAKESAAANHWEDAEWDDTGCVFHGDLNATGVHRLSCRHPNVNIHFRCTDCSTSERFEWRFCGGKEIAASQRKCYIHPSDCIIKIDSGIADVVIEHLKGLGLPFDFQGLGHENADAGWAIRTHRWLHMPATDTDLLANNPQYVAQQKAEAEEQEMWRQRNAESDAILHDPKFLEEIGNLSADAAGTDS